MRPRFPVDIVGHVALADQDHRFGPCQRGMLAGREDRRFTPSMKQMNWLVTLSLPQKWHIGSGNCQVDR
jgi:hypothetical protein